MAQRKCHIVRKVRNFIYFLIKIVHFSFQDICWPFLKDMNLWQIKKGSFQKILKKKRLNIYILYNNSEKRKILEAHSVKYQKYLINHAMNNGCLIYLRSFRFGYCLIRDRLDMATTRSFRHNYNLYAIV